MDSLGAIAPEIHGNENPSIGLLLQMAALGL